MYREPLARSAWSVRIFTSGCARSAYNGKDDVAERTGRGGVLIPVRNTAGAFHCARVTEERRRRAARSARPVKPTPQSENIAGSGIGETRNTISLKSPPCSGSDVQVFSDVFPPWPISA